MRRIGTAGLVLLALLALLWVVRAELTLAAVGTGIEWMREIGPHREIEWQRGPDVATTPPGERPPNIVLILADDMGWNDVSTHGGGAGGGTTRTERASDHFIAKPVFFAPRSVAG